VDLQHQARLGHTVLMPLPSRRATTSHDYRPTESTQSHLLTQFTYNTKLSVYPLIMAYYCSNACMYVKRESLSLQCTT